MFSILPEVSTQRKCHQWPGHDQLEALQVAIVRCYDSVMYSLAVFCISVLLIISCGIAIAKLLPKLIKQIGIIPFHP